MMQPFNESVLHAFIGLHEFHNLILVQALRRFLFSFRLPGESQKIDRMMQEFANHYCQQNPVGTSICLREIFQISGFQWLNRYV